MEAEYWHLAYKLQLNIIKAKGRNKGQNKWQGLRFRELFQLTFFMHFVWQENKKFPGKHTQGLHRVHPTFTPFFIIQEPEWKIIGKTVAGVMQRTSCDTLHYHPVPISLASLNHFLRHVFPTSKSSSLRPDLFL